MVVRKFQAPWNLFTPAEHCRMGHYILGREIRSTYEAGIFSVSIRYIRHPQIADPPIATINDFVNGLPSLFLILIQIGLLYHYIWAINIELLKCLGDDRRGRMTRVELLPLGFDHF